MTIETFWKHMKHDKKSTQGQVRFIILKTLGQAVMLDEIQIDDVNAVINDPRIA